MRAALREARRGVGQTSPNPAVGAVVVRGGRVIARGFHQRAGLPHAEVEAIGALSDPALARGATLYVTLEPCSTHGRTPPCTEAIMRAGFSRVVIGTLDPNPLHAGRAVGLLQKAGLNVRTHVLEKECRELNLYFNHWIVTRRPWVIAKAGLSLDGRLTRPSGAPRWITNAAARADTHRHRAQVDAILIGGETLRVDDPQLTVRGVPGARQPWRVVVSQSGNLSPTARLLSDEHRERTLPYIGQPLEAVLTDLGQRGITSVMIEGGTRTLGMAFDARLVHEVCFYIAPLLLGGPKVVIGGLGVGDHSEAPRIVEPKVTVLGGNLKLSGVVSYGDAT